MSVAGTSAKGGAAIGRPPRTAKRRIITFKRLVLTMLLLLIVGGAFGSVQTTTRWVTGSGYFMTDQEVEIRPSVEGAIEAVLARTSDLVEPGQVLIQLNDAVHRAALEQSLSQLEARRAQLRQLESAQALERARHKEQVFQAQQTFELSQRTLERMERGGGFAPREIEDARLRVQLAQSRLNELNIPQDQVMEDHVSVLREQILTAEKSVILHQAEVEVRKIRASLRGNVYFNRIEPGEVVKPDHVLGQIFARHAWVVKIKLPERSIGHIALGQKVYVSTAAYPTLRYGYVEASVSRILPVVSPQATGDGVFYVEARVLPGPPFPLHPGMTATAFIAAGECRWYERILGW